MIAATKTDLATLKQNRKWLVSKCVRGMGDLVIHVITAVLIQQCVSVLHSGGQSRGFAC